MFLTHIIPVLLQSFGLWTCSNCSQQKWSVSSQKLLLCLSRHLSFYYLLGCLESTVLHRGKRIEFLVLKLTACISHTKVITQVVKTASLRGLLIFCGIRTILKEKLFLNNTPQFPIDSIVIPFLQNGFAKHWCWEQG